MKFVVQDLPATPQAPLPIVRGHLSHSFVFVYIWADKLNCSKQAHKKYLITKRNSYTDCRMVSESRKQSMAWMETDYSKHSQFRWKIKWRLEHLGALGIIGNYWEYQLRPAGNEYGDCVHKFYWIKYTFLFWFELVRILVEFFYDNSIIRSSWAILVSEVLRTLRGSLPPPPPPSCIIWQ